MSDTKFELPKSKVTVKFLFKEIPGIDKDHVLYGGKLDGTMDRLCAKMSPHDIQSVVSPFDSQEEREALEKMLNLEEGGLSEHENEFWDRCFVMLKKADVTLDLAQPMDYIRYKILLQYPDLVAPSYKGRNRVASIKYYMVREDEINIERSKEADVKAEAYAKYYQISQEKEDMLDVLLAINKKITLNSCKTEWLKTTLMEMVESNPKNFLEIVKDKDFKYKALLGALVNNGLVVLKHGLYITIDGIALAADNEQATYENAINFLKDKKNQPVVLPLKDRLQTLNNRK
jgi:hypothetical protein|nr:MAG TPA: hypothetical protein [Crassvirales sp.]